MPDEHYDWIEKRSKVYTRFYPLGSDDSRASRTDDTVFGLYSLGLQTTKDAHMYNFSDAACAKNAGKLTETYLAAISDLEGNPELTLEEATRRNSSNIVWVSNLKEKLERKRLTKFDEACIRKVMFRPFILTNCYANYTFAISKYRMDQIFPEEGSENRAICVPGIGSTKPFSALMTDTMPDRHFNEACQCFPRYRYPKRTKGSDATDKIPAINRRSSRIDNIHDTTLHTFREHYSDDRIMKDTIFDYVYGVMHAPTYREEFASELSKELPRIPFAPDFHAFADAGKTLGELHLGYERCDRYPLQLVFAHEREPLPSHYRLTEKAMRFADDEKTTLRINEHVSLSGIPAEAHRYVVNGRTPLEWFIYRYVVRSEAPGVINDPNGWFADPRDLVAAIERIVHVSVESTRIIEALPREVTEE